jgi:hypothetical protein
LLASLLFIAGFFALTSSFIFSSYVTLTKAMLVGGSVILIAAVIYLSFEGICIDFKGRRFKKHIAVAGFKSGSWQSLPAITLIEVKERTIKGSNTPNGISPTLRHKFLRYDVKLLTDASKPALSIVYSRKNTALKVAERLAKEFNAELVMKH